MMRWLLLGMGCMGSACAGLATGIYATFPSDKAGSWAEFEFHKRNKDYALDVADVRPWLLPGLRATDVTLYTVKKGRRTPDESDPPPIRTEMLKLDSLAVRMQVLPRLLGTWSFGYDARLLDGSVTGHYARGAGSAELSFEIDGLDLSMAPVDKEEATIHLAGTLDGESDLVLDAEDVKASTGSLELSFDGLKLAEGSKVMGFELPVVTFTLAKVRLEAKEGKLEVTEGTFDGDLLDMTLSGEISLNKKLERSRNRMDLSVTLPEDIDRLASLAPNLKRARDADGAYHFSIGGTIVAPTFRPGKGLTGKVVRDEEDEDESGSGRLRPSGGLGEGGSDEDADPDVAREERKKKREERIKERRERLKKRREESAGAMGDEEGDARTGGPGDLELEDDDDLLPELPPDDEGPNLPNPDDDPVNDFGPGAPVEGMPDWGPPNNDRPPGDEE